MPSSSEKEWLANEIENLTHEISRYWPSEWAENFRYLQAAETALPGPYSFSVTPYLKEIIDLLDQRSPVREVSVKKAAQLGFTSGIIENGVGYLIGEVKTSPVVMMISDEDMAKKRMDRYIIPMVEHSGLSENIQAVDAKNKRKTGKKALELQWKGGGSLTCIGANAPNKMRSLPFEVVFEDEPDSYKTTIDGDPIALIETRTAGTYETTRKIFRISTPTIEETSKINKSYKEGDQREYFVPCVKCGEYQTLRFKGHNKETGLVYGLVWEKDKRGRLDPESVRYLCKFCQHPHIEGDKEEMLAKGEWRATAESVSPEIRSYFISALYSPPSMFPWASMVREWLKAWDDDLEQVKNHEKLQVFYNNKLGQTYSAKRKRIKVEDIVGHRRHQYKSGTVPNHLAEDYCGGPIGVLTCAVDIQDSFVNIAVFGWSRGQRCFLVKYEIIEGNIRDERDPAWKKLEEIILTDYYDLEGRMHYIPLTFIDYPHLSDVVENFCSRINGLRRHQKVFSTMGRTKVKKATITKDIAVFTTSKGSTGYRILVDTYKDKWDRLLRHMWPGVGEMREGQFNAPADVSDIKLKELTAEYRRPVRHGSSGEVLEYEWHRPQGSKNELWDLLMYATAAMELIAYEYCVHALELQELHWGMFWDRLDKERGYSYLPPK